MRHLTALSLSLFLVLGFAVPGSAQIFTVGVKGGATFSSLDVQGSGFPEVGRRTGTVVGASLELGLGMIGIRPEVLLVQKGFEARSGSSEAVFAVDYIEVPLLLVARFGSGSVRPAIYGGPVVALERSCSISGDFPDFTATGDCDAPSVDLDRETTDAGAAFGAELSVKLGGINLVADARYTMGLVNLDPEEENELRSRVFSAMAGIQIPIG